MRSNAMKRFFPALWVFFFAWQTPSLWAVDVKATTRVARACLDKGIRFFYSLNQEGGYVYYVTTDLKERWGEGRLNADTIEVQAPGTPTVGRAFLRAYRATRQEDYLQMAWDAGAALLRGQNDLGGWGHTIRLNGPASKRVSFDDNQTQGAIRFLMDLDQEMDEASLTEGIHKALALMLEAQLANGGWPHMYPARGDYHDYATFNDHGINDCIKVMVDAVGYYDNPRYRESLHKVGRFLMISQLPPPQPGWAQQYNEYLQPAWARDYEPPAVCPQVTVNNLNTLMDLYEFMNHSLYLKPIPDALRWLESCRLPNGRWARFVELGTGKALYYDRDRIRVDSTAELHIERRTGYGYETDLSGRLEQVKRRFAGIKDKQAKESPRVDRGSLERLVPKIKAVVKAQDGQGRWINRNDRFKRQVKGKRWNGEYDVKDRISSAVFIRNVNRLCEFLEYYHQIVEEK